MTASAFLFVVASASLFVAVAGAGKSDGVLFFVAASAFFFLRVHLHLCLWLQLVQGKVTGCCLHVMILNSMNMFFNSMYCCATLQDPVRKKAERITRL